MLSRVVEYLQGIQMAIEAIDKCKNGSGNLAIVYGHFIRANDVHTKYDMSSNTL
jgi:hypothetical protein